MTESLSTQDLVQALDEALPQTQCTRCGFPDCHSYAQAMARGEAEINRCPPGGAEGVARLAVLTGRPALPLNAEHGSEGPRRRAVIDETGCIGCTLCLKACPVDSIVGAPKRMHTVIDDLCTGCELCIPVCPVDCIFLEAADCENPQDRATPDPLPEGGQEIWGSGPAFPGKELTGWSAWSLSQARQAKERFEFHRLRLQRTEAENRQRLSGRAFANSGTDPGAGSAPSGEPAGKRAVIEAIMARARARNRSDSGF